MIILLYILKSILTNTFISSLIIIGIVWLSQSFRSIKFVLEKGGGILDYLYLSFLSMPAWLSISLTFGTFFGILITYSKLIKEREIIVMQSSGLSSFKISLPGVVSSFVVFIILFLNLHFLLPTSYTLYKNFQDEIRYRTPDISLNKSVFLDIDKNKTLYFKEKIGKTTITNIFIQDRTDSFKTTEIIAEKGEFVLKNNNIYLILKNGTKIISDRKKIPTIIDFKSNIIDYKSFTNNEKKLKKDTRVIEYNEFTFFELLNLSKIYTHKKNKFLSEAHSRNVDSILPIVFSLIVLVFMLLKKYDKKEDFFIKSLIFGIVIFIQSLIIVIKNLSSENILFVIFLYLIPLIIIFISLICIFFETQLKLFKYKAKL